MFINKGIHPNTKAKSNSTLAINDEFMTKVFPTELNSLNCCPC